jgi:hypothetical protein
MLTINAVNHFHDSSSASMQEYRFPWLNITISWLQITTTHDFRSLSMTATHLPWLQLTSQVSSLIFPWLQPTSHDCSSHPAPMTTSHFPPLSLISLVRSTVLAACTLTYCFLWLLSNVQSIPVASAGQLVCWQMTSHDCWLQFCKYSSALLESDHWQMVSIES